MIKEIKELEQGILQAIAAADSLAGLEDVRVKHLGRKSALSQLLRSVKELSDEDKVRYGQLLNDTKRKLEIELEKKQIDLEGQEINQRIEHEQIDVTAPGKKIERGHLHPLTKARRDIEAIFRSMGFLVLEGPEVDSEWYNFDALNIPSDHPARDMQDTFWIKQSETATKDPRKHLLPRTHTSGMQVRYMEKHQPPFRILVPGRVFRNEATDATHEMQFYQFEGLMVGKDVSLANLKGIMTYFFKRFFKKDVEVRFVPSYFPFTEPSVEIFVRIPGTVPPSHKASDGQDKIYNKWLEMAGAGMVHQNVFKAAGYAPGEYQGFAFGMTIDRLVLLRHGIDDIRLLYGSDMRFLEQF